MTRKDYLLAVEVIGEITKANMQEKSVVIEYFKRFFERDNCRFNPDRFSDACYKNDKPSKLHTPRFSSVK